LAFILVAVYMFVLLCEYSKFRIQSNSYLNTRFDSKRAQLFKIFKRRRLFTLATTSSNQQNQQTWSRLRRLKALNVV